jgi:hypothetical protein
MENDELQQKFIIQLRNNAQWRIETKCVTRFMEYTKGSVYAL